VKVWTTPCERAYPGIRITVTGQYDDMLKIRGVRVWPSAIKDIITSFAPRVTSQLEFILTQQPMQHRVDGPTH